MTQLKDTAVHPQLSTINDLLNELDTQVSALPLASGEAHAHLQGSLFRFRAAFNGLELVKSGPACTIVNGLPTYLEVTE